VRPVVEHAWDVSLDEALRVQQELSRRLIMRTTFAPAAVQRVAGIDVAFRHGIARAAVVVLAFPALEVLDYALADVPVCFPYVPGLLAFREAPATLAALSRLSQTPDILICDGHGYAHPRRFGLASHLGVLLDLPAIGCAKSCLIGTHAEPGPAAGDWAPLVDAAEIIGAALRTRAGARPLYVSVGHRVDLHTAVAIVMACTRRQRLPETTRQAHHLAKTGELGRL